MRFHFNQWDSAKCFCLFFPSYSQSLDVLIFITCIFTPGRLDCSLLSVNSYSFGFPIRAVLLGWLLPAPWLAQGWDEPGFSLTCGSSLSSAASDSWLRSRRQCVQFYSSRCEIIFEMLSWKVEKLGWLLYHSPWCNGRFVCKRQRVCLCNLLACSWHPCALNRLYCGTLTSPGEQGLTQM